MSTPEDNADIAASLRELDEIETLVAGVVKRHDMELPACAMSALSRLRTELHMASNDVRYIQHYIQDTPPTPATAVNPKAGRAAA